MQDFRTSYKWKEINKRSKDKTKLKLWCLLLPILWSRTRSNRLRLKMIRWWDILKISWGKKNKKMKERGELLKSKRGRWDNTLLGRLSKKGKNKLTRRRLMRSKQLFGRKIQMLSMKMKIRSITTWRMFTRSMSKYYWLKWKIRKIIKIVRKWTLWNYYTIRLWWSRQLRTSRM